MRCPKCHFVSFDYLAHCKKCGADLAVERSRLNLPDFEPRIPQFLGVLDVAEEGLESLLEPEESQEEVALSLSDEGGEIISLDEPIEFDRGPELVLDESLGEEPSAAPMPARPDIEAQAEGPELSLQDSQEDGDLVLVLDDDEAGQDPNRGAAAPADEAPIELVIDDEDLELELSPEEMERIILELEADGEDPDKTE